MRGVDFFFCCIHLLFIYMSVVAIRLHDIIYMYVQRTKSARYQKNLMQILLKMNFSKCVYKLYILTALTKTQIL